MLSKYSFMLRGTNFVYYNYIMRQDVTNREKFASDLFIKWLVYVTVYVPSHCICCVLIQGGSNMTGTDLYVNKPHCAAAVRP